MFDKIEPNPEDAFQLSLSFLELLDRNLMSIFEQEFAHFESPNKSNGQNKAQSVNSFQFGQVCVFEVKAPGFPSGKKHFDAPAFTI